MDKSNSDKLVTSTSEFSKTLLDPNDITSPSQLNEVSTCPDHTFTNYTLRSPEGPRGGRSIKEFEEQLSLYKKENFNLKLRIYFLEERMGANFNLEKEKIVKNNVELMVENQSLKKELQEKHDLLCQAVKAMDLEEEEFKNKAQAKNEEIAVLKQELEDLRMQFNVKCNERSDIFSTKHFQDGKYDDSASCNKSYHSEPIYFSSQLSTLPETGNRVRALQERISSLEDELSKEKQNNASVQMILDRAEVVNTKYEQLLTECGKKDESIKSLRDEQELAKDKISKLSLQLNKLEKLDEQSKHEVENLTKLLNEKTKSNEEMEEQLYEIKKRLSAIKVDFDREREKFDRMKIVNELRVSELEDELKKQKAKVQELQMKLCTVQQDLKEKQNLLVPKSPKTRTIAINTDDHHVSVPNSTTPTRVQKEDALCDALTFNASPSSKSPVKKLSFDFDHIRQILTNIQFNEKSKVLTCYDQLCESVQKNEQKIVELKCQELKACALIQGLMQRCRKSDEQIKRLNVQIAKLEKELEGVVSKPQSQLDKLNQFKESQERRDEDEALVQELENKIQILELTLKEKDVHLKYIEEQNRALQNNLQEKEKEMLSMSVKSPDAQNSEPSGFLSNVLDEKNKEIEKLNDELRKRTHDLQAVVNKELWQKNREIEKLQLKYSQLLENKEGEMMEIKKSFAALSGNLEELRVENEEKHNENSNLKIDISDLKLQLQLLRDKISEIGLISDDQLEVEIVISSLDNVKTIQNQLEQVTSEKEILTKKINELEHVSTEVALELPTTTELQTLQRNFEISESLRANTNKMCNLLCNQMEELALFLDSLMKQKSVLGFLGNSQNRKLREFIDNSLDLSKSLNLTLSMNPDQSLMQLSNISELLNCTDSNDEPNRYSFSLIPEQATVSYSSNVFKISNNSSEGNREFFIKSLQDQIEMLQRDLKLKNNELIKFKREHKTSRSLSKPRISPSKLKKTALVQKDSEDSESWSEPDMNVSKARIGLFKDENELIGVEEFHSTDSTDESLTNLSRKRSDILNECQTTITRLNKQVVELQKKLQEKTAKLEELQQENESLKCDISTRAELEQELSELKIKIDQLETEKNELSSNYSKQEKEIVQIKFERDGLVNMTKDYANMTANSRQDILQLEQKLMRTSIEKERIENALKQVITEKDGRLKEIEQTSHRKITELTDKISELLKDYTENYVKKSQLDAEIHQVQMLKSQIESMTNALEISRNNEKTSKDQLNKLQVAMNEMNAQHEELSNEKTRLEKVLSLATNDRNELELQLNDAQQELSSAKELHQKENNLLQSFKTKLELKLSELEYQNAELRNKIAKLSASAEHYNSLPTQIGDSNKSTFMRQISSEAPSYISEDDVRANRGHFSIVIPQKIDSERIEANSSPDLGIESDQGRFSSLEVQTQQPLRPLLQTIEITESMNNLLDGDNNSIQSVCGNKTCYQKLVELCQENDSLKKKLVKTRRAFEDTAIQLTLANQRKKQIEKNICKQITRTSQVLREAKANLDSGSETDFHKK